MYKILKVKSDINEYSPAKEEEINGDIFQISKDEILNPCLFS